MRVPVILSIRLFVTLHVCLFVCDTSHTMYTCLSVRATVCAFVYVFV